MTPEELAQFQQDGFLIVRNMASADLVQRMRNITMQGVERRVAPLEFEAELQYPGAPANEAEGSDTIRRLKQAHSRDYVFTEWLLNPLLRNRLKQILGQQVVCPLAHHNCIMTKQPQFSSDTGWHQDIRYWSFEQRELVSVWLALGTEAQNNGCLQVIPGSHRELFAPQRFDSELFFRNDLAENEDVLARRVFAELNAGDVLFFHCRTLHAATRNFSEKTKYSVVFTFRSLDNPPIPGSRSSSSPEILLH